MVHSSHFAAAAAAALSHSLSTPGLPFYEAAQGPDVGAAGTLLGAGAEPAEVGGSLPGRRAAAAAAAGGSLAVADSSGSPAPAAAAEEGDSSLSWGQRAAAASARG